MLSPERVRGPQGELAVAQDGRLVPLSALTLIPHTAQRTTLGGLRPGGAVNVEVDVLAKYVERIIRTK